jgi:hypothetical protein
MQSRKSANKGLNKAQIEMLPQFKHYIKDEAANKEKIQ